MIYRLLGEVEVRDGSGNLVELPRGHYRTVLAMLLVRANQQVPKADLIRAGWGEDGISNAQLYKAVSALRKLLAKAGQPPEVIDTHDRFGYRLQVPDGELDMLVLQGLVAQADAARDAGRADDEACRLRQALDLWRGPQPLANVDQEPFRTVIDGLNARRRRIAARLFALENRRGSYAAIIDELHQFVADAPAQGELCRQLMYALYKTGHRLDALRIYERHVEALDQTTSGRPEASLRVLHYAILDGKDDVVATAMGIPPEPAVSPDPTPWQLPRAAEDFVGRARLRAEVTWLLKHPTMPVLVISGPGGIGKTALALRAAQDAVAVFPDGQLWARLRGTTGQPAEVSEVLAEFLRALGVTAVPESTHERASLFRSLLSGRRVLIVLDDAESGTQVSDLVPGGTGCVVLITARRRLPGIPGGVHHVAPLEPFDHAVAAELFRTIVRAGQVDLTGQDEDVDAVVRMCGGLPLALRIAAALRVEDFHRPTADLRRRLAEHGPDAFEHGDASLSRTLGAGLAPLDELVRRLFLRLGLLTGPTFGEWTAAALLDLPGEVAGDALSQLASVSMIEPIGGSGYRFHDLTREYARRRAEAELSPAVRAEAELRALRALLTLVRRAHAELYGGDFEVVHSDLPDVEVAGRALEEIRQSPKDWFERERANVRAGVERAAELGEVDLCWDLAVSSHEFYTIGDFFDDWRVTHEVALAAARDAGDRRAEGVLLAMLGQPPLVASGSPGVSGVPEMAQAVRLLTAAGDRHGLAIALRTLGNAMRRRGELTRPLAAFREALAHYRAAGDTAGVLQTLRFIGQTHLDRGELGEALDFFGQAEQTARALGRHRLVAQTRYWAGRASLAMGERGAARDAFGDVLAVFPPDQKQGHAYAQHGFGELAIAEGDLDAARGFLIEAGSMAHASADVILEGRVALSVAELEKRRGEPVDQLVALLRAVARFRACGSAFLEIQAQTLLAEAYAAQGDALAVAAARHRIDVLCADVPPEDRPKQ